MSIVPKDGAFSGASFQSKATVGRVVSHAGKEKAPMALSRDLLIVAITLKTEVCCTVGLKVVSRLLPTHGEVYFACFYCTLRTRSRDYQVNFAHLYQVA